MRVLRRAMAARLVQDPAAAGPHGLAEQPQPRSAHAPSLWAAQQPRDQLRVLQHAQLITPRAGILRWLQCGLSFNTQDLKACMLFSPLYNLYWDSYQG